MCQLSRGFIYIVLCKSWSTEQQRPGQVCTSWMSWTTRQKMSSGWLSSGGAS